MSSSDSEHLKALSSSAKKQWDALDAYKDKEKWEAMSKDDRALLALLFIQQGETLLKNNDKSGVKSFKLARRIAPNNLQHLFRQAIALADRKENLDLIQESNACLNKIIKLNPEYADAYLLLGKNFQILSHAAKDVDLLYKSDAAFARAEKLLIDSKGVLNIELYWNWGETWVILSRVSGEPYEINKAIHFFKKAEALGCNETKFWIVFGNAFSEAAFLSDNQEYFLEGLRCYRNATLLSSENYTAWFNLACSYFHQYKKIPSNDTFHLASKAFEKACSLGADDYMIWVKYAQLLNAKGRLTGDPEDIRSSIYKYQKAYDLAANNDLVIGQMSEAFLNLGQATQDIQSIRKAEELILKAIQIKSDSISHLYLYGSCLFEKGEYFSDEGYYRDAIQIYSKVLTLDTNHQAARHSIATVNYALAMVTKDEAYLHKALEQYEILGRIPGVDRFEYLLDYALALMTLGEFTADPEPLFGAVRIYEDEINILGEEIYKKVHFRPLYHYACCLDFLGVFLEEVSFFEKAIEQLKIVLEVSPEFLDARYSLAEAYAHLAEETEDFEAYKSSLHYYESLEHYLFEEESYYNNWGETLLSLASLVEDPTIPGNANRIFLDAEARLSKAASLGSLDAYYNLACLYSLTNRYSLAMQFLQKAKQAGQILSVPMLLEDEWIRPLHALDEFQDFISQF